MAKQKKTTKTKKTAQTKNEPSPKDAGVADEYKLPIEPKPGRSAGGGLRGRRLMVLLSLALGAGAGLLVWWLGSNL